MSSISLVPDGRPSLHSRLQPKAPVRASSHKMLQGSSMAFKPGLISLWDEQMTLDSQKLENLWKLIGNMAVR